MLSKTDRHGLFHLRDKAYWLFPHPKDCVWREDIRLDFAKMSFS